jgi:hypothetical protein
MIQLSLSLLARIAGAVLLCPPDIIEQSLPMVAPLPLSMPELQRRQTVDRLLQECWGSGDGFEVQLSDEWIVNGGSFLEEEEVKIEAQIRPSTYGEITPLGVRQLFHHMGMTSPIRKTDMAFIDLGSGAGKLVAQAYLELKHLKYAVGVELAPSRHEAALVAKSKLSHRLASNEEITPSSKLEFIEGDLFQTNLSDATHIYVSSLCFTQEMMQQLEEKLKSEACNVECVASLKRFSDMGKPSIEYVEMSWTKPNGSPVYFYTRN